MRARARGSAMLSITSCMHERSGMEISRDCAVCSVVRRVRVVAATRHEWRLVLKEPFCLLKMRPGGGGWGGVGVYQKDNKTMPKGSSTVS